MARQEVEATVAEVSGGECPHYKVGDRLVFKNQVFDPANCSVRVFCVHSINDIYDAMMKLRHEGKVGDTVRVACADNRIVKFELRLTVSEQS
jgi:uncharacterized repeat protein (TIGR04076 family)